jgi:ABC-2 type transport system permease protein
MYAILFFFVIKLNIITMLEFILISCLCISGVTLIGIFIDSLQPKLFWDDENNALRENYNTFISMGICTLLFIIICIGSYSKLYKQLGYNFTQIFIMIFGVLLIINSVMGLINIHSTIKNINEQE